MNHFFIQYISMKEVKKKYPVGVIKTMDGKIDIYLTLQNEIN